MATSLSLSLFLFLLLHHTFTHREGKRETEKLNCWGELRQENRKKEEEEISNARKNMSSVSCGPWPPLTLLHFQFLIIFIIVKSGLHPLLFCCPNPWLIEDHLTMPLFSRFFLFFPLEIGWFWIYLLDFLLLYFILFGILWLYPASRNVI